MKILAVETSTEYCSAALWQDGALSERCELVGQKHSELLMAMLDDLLKAAGITLARLDFNPRARGRYCVRQRHHCADPPSTPRSRG